MKTITIQCFNCETSFEKPLKEYTRRCKLAADAKFFCSFECSGKQKTSYIKGKNPFITGSDHHKKALAAAQTTNTKFFGIEKSFSKLLRSCKQRKWECDIDLDYLIAVWQSQEGRCKISNIPLTFESNDYIQLPSVDRIDGTKGYIKGNVQFVSCSVNLAKSTMSDDRVHELLRLICRHYTG
jgi:hypothetical protein